ncbi:MAG: hypothetical protein OXH04_06590 [Acidobacteria bacterium]|nr:hypothetical protein [Acidobacteriota bacterium]
MVMPRVAITVPTIHLMSRVPTAAISVRKAASLVRKPARLAAHSSWGLARLVAVRFTRATGRWGVFGVISIGAPMGSRDPLSQSRRTIQNYQESPLRARST